MFLISLEVFWYIIIIASVTCYAMLDGFDLGVGALHLFARDDEERRVFLNSIGPVWDGNEVWLVILVGALFAGFPIVYGTLFSAFYLPLSFLIVGLIFRAVAIEFRSKHTSKRWRSTWDVLFSFASILIAILVGVALGNLIMGLPLDANHDYVREGLLRYFKPYPLLIGILTLSLFMMHGSIYLVMKTEGVLQENLKQWVRPTTIFFIITYVVVTMVTLIYQTHMAERIRARPYLFIIAFINMLVIADIPREVFKGRYGWAFIASCFNIALLLVLFALGTFPNLIRSTIDPKNNSLTVFNSASSQSTLILLAIIVAIGLPLVFAYGFYIYRIFRGKVKLDSTSY